MDSPLARSPLPSSNRQDSLSLQSGSPTASLESLPAWPSAGVDRSQSHRKSIQRSDRASRSALCLSLSTFPQRTAGRRTTELSMTQISSPAATNHRGGDSAIRAPLWDGRRRRGCRWLDGRGTQRRALVGLGEMRAQSARDRGTVWADGCAGRGATPAPALAAFRRDDCD